VKRAAAGIAASDRKADESVKRGDRMAKTTTIYGIKNCDTMKKARSWLDKHGVDYAFHDYKTAGIDRAKLETWAKKTGWETLLNRAGTTFKKLPDKDKMGLTEKKALALMLKQPSMIKRPVLELSGGKLLVGFKPEEYAASVK
jgi:arsenate reductase